MNLTGVLWEATKLSKQLQENHVTLGEAFFRTQMLKRAYSADAIYQIPIVRTKRRSEEENSTENERNKGDEADEESLMSSAKITLVERRYEDLAGPSVCTFALGASEFKISR